MDESTTLAPEQTPTLAGLGIEIEADATVGYASIQNAVPVVRSLRVTNHGDEPVEGIELVLTCNPAFARGAKFRFELLGPKESRAVSPVDLHPDHAFLSDLQESLMASLTAVAAANGGELARTVRPLQVLAYDQWAGTRALPELLAAFSMPNNPAVDILVGKASQLLRKSHPELSMDGYQSKNREVVWKQVSAIYSTIAAENLQYAEPPASFGNDGQKIRTPDRILEAKVATCLDLAMLFCSCLEQAGLRSAVLFKKGHAWVGVWLHQASFAHPLLDDAQDVRKRVTTGEFIAFETTGVALHASHRPSLRIALERGQEHLDSDEFLFVIDVFMARGAQIRPLPSRVTMARATMDDAALVAEDIEPLPVLPPLDPDSLAPIDIAAEDTPEGRLAKWKAKLLDLTLRNRLLNFKTTKTTLQLVAPDLAALEDALAEGQEFNVKPLPTSFADGADPRMAQVHAGRTGRAPLDDMAKDALANKALIARVRPETLDGNLLGIHSAAKTGLEEGGANTLYLAIGLLKWTEAEKSEASHLAPILLVPVTLTRQSVRSGYRLARHDDEAIVNPTLLQLLRSAFELKVPGLDVAPTDEKGVDVQRILQAFRLAVRDIAKWEVLDEAHLGIFSFTKYLMWKDLQDRTEQLKGNQVVKHLIENPGQAFATEPDDRDRQRLDDAYQPQDIFAPMLSDSSQLAAICAVDSGRNLVLEGPPGTGKSQTITNIIAHSLAKGRTVLFVSEKMAALEVVHRRLTDIGLAPFCLELHSSKTKKTEVLAQLGKALEVGGAKTENEWSREAERLASLRRELNGVVDSLHREHPNGLSAYEAIGTCLERHGQPCSDMPWTDPNTHGHDELDRLRELARRISALGQALPQLDGHPLALIGRPDWSPTWQDQLVGGAGQLSAAAETLKGKFASVAQLLGLAPSGASSEMLAAVDHLANVLLAAPKVPTPLARKAHDSQARARVQALVNHGRARQGHWVRVGAGWTAQFAKLNAVELRGQWSLAVHAWWPKSWFAKRAVLGRLAAVREDGKAPAGSALDAALGPLADVNDEDHILAGMQAEAEALLQEAYSGIQTDWSAVENHAAWAKAFTDATARLSGSDFAFGESLQQHLEPLVGEQRALLEPAGAVGRSLLEYRNAYRELLSKLDVVNELARPVQPLAGPADANGALERMQSHLQRWQQSQRALQSWCLWRNVRDIAVAQGLQGLVMTVESGRVALADVEGHFEHSYRSWWLKRTVDADPVLRGFSSADHERKIHEFRAADTKFQELTKAYIAATLSVKVPSATSALVGADSEMGKLRRELQKQRKHMPVRQLVQGMPTLLPKLKPCLLMSPLSVAQYLAAGHSQFDLVVFDEASQIAVWDAVGVIARGQQLVVVGDPKQLPPTSFFSSGDSGDGGGDGQQVDDLESILDECLGAGMNRRSLKWHYRSRHESLITFSNVHYYDSELVTFPSPVTDDVAVRFEKVDGLYDRGGSRTNRAEADAIVDAIEQHYLKEGGKGKSVGVVTFNSTQQTLILTLLDARRRANATLDKALAQAAQEPLFVKNLENVQGDERDIIFFSITYGPDASGKVTMNFGPLNGEGGHRRLNVAISRARHGVVIFSTLKPEQIDLNRVRAAGVRDLKHYLEFAQRGPRAIVEQAIPTGLTPDSPFEAAVIKMLRDRGWVVHPQVGCSGYRVDLGIVDPRAPGRYLAGVECDGRTYHSAATARDRDRLRQHILEGLGWRLHRIWSTDWWLDPERELEKLIAKLDALLQAPAPEEAEASADAQMQDDEAGSADASDLGSPATQQDVSPLPESLPIYMVAELDAGKPEAFYEFSSAATLQQQIAAVIDIEGPVLETVLFKRIARAWGLERTGPRIVERLRKLTPSLVVKTVDGDRTFYWASGSTPAHLCPFRVASDNELTRRPIGEVCLEEVASLMRHVLSQAGGSTKTELARICCKLLGLSRMTAEAETRAMAAADLLVSIGIARLDGDAIRLL
nr:DUF3320 domain-containing protein [Variovorax boronicumulans]